MHKSMHQTGVNAVFEGASSPETVSFDRCRFIFSYTYTKMVLAYFFLVATVSHLVKKNERLFPMFNILDYGAKCSNAPQAARFISIPFLL